MLQVEGGKVKERGGRESKDSFIYAVALMFNWREGKRERESGVGVGGGGAAMYIVHVRRHSHIRPFLLGV